MMDDLSRMPPPRSPSLEVLLAHERDIVPQPEIVRARALSRAREALRAAEVVMLPRRVAPSPVRRLFYAAAAGIVLTAGAAAAYQMLRRPEMAPSAGAGTPAAARHTHAKGSATEPAPESLRGPEVAPEPIMAPREQAPSRRAGLAARHAVPPEELRLLVRARHADARGDYLAVLAVLAEHERNHPAGRLAEEREVLRVKALVGLGRGSEARQVATKFRREFPRSVLLHKIEDMLASLR